MCSSLLCTGLTFLQYPSQPVVARLGTSLSLTCVVGCRTPQCKVWWARATSSSGAERRFLSVSNRYWLKKGVVYPTYADRNSQLEVHLKLIIQKVTFDHYGIYECQAFENRNVTKRAGPIQLKAPQLNFGSKERLYRTEIQKFAHAAMMKHIQCNCKFSFAHFLYRTHTDTNIRSI